MITKLKKAILIEFQKHGKLEIEFKDGVNIIGGASRRGKSCIRRAIEWVCFDEKIDNIRKEGSKQTSVKLFFDGDISVERVRSSSINRYVLTVKGEEKVFDAIGKEIPEDVKTSMGLSTISIEKDTINLNVAKQITLPFLLDKSGTFRMKLFNQLTGNDLQDKLLVSFNKSILQKNRSVKTKQEDLNIKTDELGVANLEKKNIEEKVAMFEDFYVTIINNQKNLEKIILLKKEYEKEIESLENISNELQSSKVVSKEEIENLNGELEKYQEVKILKDHYSNEILKINKSKEDVKNVRVVDPKDIDTLNVDIVSLHVLSGLRSSLSKGLSKVNDIAGQLKHKDSVEIDFVDLEANIKRLTTVFKIKNDLKIEKLKKSDIQTNLAEAVTKYEDSLLQYKQYLKELGKCPTCSSDMTEECIERIKI